MAVEIGPGRPGQYTAVLSFWRQAGAVPSSTDDLDGLAALCGRDPGALMVATEDGAVVGTLIAAWDGWRGAFYRLAVAPDRRLAGVGRALVATGERRLQSLGARRISLYAVPDHDPAMEFWRALGYHLDPDVRFVRDLEAPQ